MSAYPKPLKPEVETLVTQKEKLFSAKDSKDAQDAKDLWCIRGAPLEFLASLADKPFIVIMMPVGGKFKTKTIFRHDNG